jgi:diguanylate cyclase (GGDEF)-like protein
VLGAIAPSAALAKPIDLAGKWSRASEGHRHEGAEPSLASHTALDELDLTGGRFLHDAHFVVKRAGRYVIDIKNTSTIGRFRHLVFDERGALVADLSGGIQSAQPNPFFLRHGRELALTAGRYRLITELDSPFLLAQPEPYVDDLDSYRQAIKPGNALVLLCLGVFIGLGLYYAALSAARRRMADAMYALFILGNLLYNGTALLVYPDLFGMRWFYLVSVPILFSNAAYVLFVMALLEIDRDNHPRLHQAGRALLLVFAGFIALAAVHPNWSLEFDRIGVGLFATYGLVAATLRARQGNSSAKVYLVAIAAFFVLGLLAISLSRLAAHTIYIEHVGLVAVAVEVSLLALVLAHQFALLSREKESALRRATHSIRIAHTDALTGLPNRYQLEADLSDLPSQGSLTFIDLDGLKHYNDMFGHQRGDALLCGFADQLSSRLGGSALLYRLGGDEFAITCASGDLVFVELMIAGALHALQSDGFEFAGASSGSVHVHECATSDGLKHLADTRMYEQKVQRRSLNPRAITSQN